MLCFSAIAWKQKKFRFKFKIEDNCIEITKLTTRLPDAHTTQLATALQDEISDWLRTVGENAAAAWFERYWTGDRGNYTYA